MGNQLFDKGWDNDISSTMRHEMIRQWMNETDYSSMIIPSVLTLTEINILINPFLLNQNWIKEPFSYIFDQRLTTPAQDRSDENEHETKKSVRLLRLFWFK